MTFELSEIAEFKSGLTLFRAKLELERGEPALLFECGLALVVTASDSSGTVWLASGELDSAAKEVAVDEGLTGVGPCS